MTEICKSFVSTSTQSKTSFISPPYAPAFITTAPPNVPGIPEANASPASPASAAVAAAAVNKAPLWIYMFVPSSRISCIRRHNWMTAPRIPPSPTSRLLPFPIIRYGIFHSRKICMQSINSSVFFGIKKTSALPPVLKVVCFAMLSSIRNPSLPNRSYNFIFHSSILLSFILPSSSDCPISAVPIPLPYWYPFFSDGWSWLQIHK